MNQVSGHSAICPAEGLPEAMRPWFALYCEWGHEFHAVADLQRRGHACLLPTYKSQRVWKHGGSGGKRVVELVRPLFPGYIFSPETIAQHVLYAVGFPEPMAISHKELELVRLLVEHGLDMEPEDPMAIEPGDTVELTSGPMKGAYGRVVERRDKLRLVVSLDMLGRSCSTIIERDWIGDVIRRQRRVS